MDITNGATNSNNTEASNAIKKLLLEFEDLFEGMGINPYEEDDQSHTSTSSIESIDVTFGIADSINLAQTKKENKKKTIGRKNGRHNNNEEEGASQMEEGGPNKIQRLCHGRRRSGVRRGFNTSSDTAFNSGDDKK